MNRTMILSGLCMGLAMNSVSSANHEPSVPQPRAQLPGLFRFERTDEGGNAHVKVDLQVLAAARSATAGLDTQIPLAPNDTVSLKLERFDVLNAQSQFVRAGRKGAEPMPAPQVLLLRGEIPGEPGSHAFIALTLSGGGGGSGSITRGNGTQYHLATDRDGGGLIVHSGPSMLPDFPEFCALVRPPGQGQADGGIAGGGEVEADRGLRVLTVAIDSDQKYWQLFNNDTQALDYMVQLVGAVSDIYMRDLGYKLILGFSRIWPEGGEPFGADDLSGFRDYWIANEDMTGLNLVHLMSGRRDLAYGGIAYLASGCSDFAFAISGFLLGGFPSPVAQPDLGNWDVVVMAHEMGHNMGTAHTHDYSPPIDQCAFGTNERGTIMSYCHVRPGGLLNIDMRFHAITADFIDNNNPPGGCLWHDCNGNGANDLDDIASAFSADVNKNGIPDECEDCNGNGILDPDDIAGGQPDINANGIPDTCEADCNGNGIPDRWEISQHLGGVEDRNGNNIPDACEPDCDGNGIADFLDIHNGTYTDVDRDSVPDICQDCNGNGIADWIDVGREFNLYVGQVSGSVREYHAASGVPIQELGILSLTSAYDVAFGADRQLYVASFGDNRIVRINVDTGAATNFVPPGGGGLGRPSGLTFGPDGNLYVSSQFSSSILKFNGVTGAPMGAFVPPSSGSLSSPWQLTFGPNGNLFVVSSNNRILQYNGATGAFINIYADAIGGLNGPRGLLFLPNGHLLVSNRAANTVMHFGPFGQPLGQYNDEYPLQQPWGMTLGRNGNVYIASTTGAVRIIEYDQPTGRYIRSWVRGDDALTAPAAFAFRPASANDKNGNGLPDSCDNLCPADIAPLGPGGGNGAVDTGDLLAVINSWGPCADPNNCPADIAPPPGGDNTVNVADLLMVINSWGPCP